MQTAPPKETLSNKEAAALLGCTPKTLEVWRCTGRVRIPYHKVGRRVVYRRRDLEAFLEANREG